MHPVCELDQNHADIFDHGKHHLAETLGLGFGATGEVHLIEFGNAVHERGDLTAKLRFQIGNRRFRVFDDIVQDRRGNGLRVHAHVSEDLRDGDRMRNVGLARHSGLSVVGQRAEFVCLKHGFDLLIRHVRFKRFGQAPHVAAASSRQPGQFG